MTHDIAGGGATDDEARIRGLIERWARAVHEGDLEAVLADHADDIVMFDVPPPDDGVRGTAAYRETWPPFFEWQRQGAVFDIVDLDITAGRDVAFARALLRCGTAEELARVRVFCDDWEQASHNGDLVHAVEAGVLRRDDVTELGAVLAGTAEGRRSADEATAFDSTGLAIQDLAIALAALERLDALGDIPTIEL